MSGTVEDVGPEEMGEVMNDVSVEIGGDAQPLSALVQDIQMGHKELDDYKSGSLALTQALDERIDVAESDESPEFLLEILNDLRDTAFGIYLRIQRGDEELVGDRDGEYSGHFE
jgi:hypothetical protein